MASANQTELHYDPANAQWVFKYRKDGRWFTLLDASGRPDEMIDLLPTYESKGRFKPEDKEIHIYMQRKLFDG